MKTEGGTELVNVDCIKRLFIAVTDPNTDKSIFYIKAETTDGDEKTLYIGYSLAAVKGIFENYAQNLGAM